MICKNCNRFDTVPGIKWGICDVRRMTTDSVKYLLTSPDKTCSYEKNNKKGADTDGLQSS